MLTAKDFIRGSRPKAPAPTGCPRTEAAKGSWQEDSRNGTADGEDEASHITNHKSQLSKMSFQPAEKERERKIILYILYII